MTQTGLCISVLKEDKMGRVSALATTIQIKLGRGRCRVISIVSFLVVSDPASYNLSFSLSLQWVVPTARGVVFHLLSICWADFLNSLPRFTLLMFLAAFDWRLPAVNSGGLCYWAAAFGSTTMPWAPAASFLAVAPYPWSAPSPALAPPYN